MRLPAPLVLLLIVAAAGACDTDQAPSGVPVPSLSGFATESPTDSPSGRASPAPVPAGLLPKRSLTPGEVFAGLSAQQVCVSGYASKVRNVLQAQYVQVYASYAVPYPEPAGSYELDHLVPLELGGDNSNRNLWPEPAQPVPGFQQKDQLENYLHDAVCGGRMALGDAQAGIAFDWIALYHQYVQP